MSGAAYDERIRRAEELARGHASASEALRFYAEVAAFQKFVYGGLTASCTAASLGARIPELRLLVERAGPRKLADAARDRDWADLPQRFWTTRESQDEASAFFARALLQPWAEWRAERSNADPANQGKPLCPFCDGRPVAAILRPEGHGAKRSLLCSLCATEWSFARVRCPACGEENFERLPVYTAPEFECLRVEACEGCGKYLKSVDLTKNGLAVPVVDELAALPLDLWAREHGYCKLERNLLGF
jgi:FdhE protein